VQFDAFGNDMSEPLFSTRSFAWRGQEGSVTDRNSGLIYMQSRHYDPSIGRFIQADALPVASLTTQGLNRYIYCENDPVNASDPSGLSWGGLFVLAVILIILASWMALLIKWFILTDRVCNMPRAKVNINSRTMGPADELRFAFEGLDESLPPGTSMNPLGAPAKDFWSALADIINFWLSKL